MTDFSLTDLQAIVVARAGVSPDESWTAKLVAAGPERVARKFGEEAVETLIASLGTDRAALVAESADLLYHWMVLMHVRQVTVADVMAELERRSAQSGLAEKASRKAD